uniref:E3 ubiquitin-protein ligase RBBP6 n=1 Tax=Cacopsylla melanoneura TaxID=428564 RepID=A0A8D8WF45_9HEMI
MSVYYKFKTSQSFDTIKFDGLHISLGDLKKAIYHQKQIGKNPDFDLLITNAQDNTVYADDNELINRNASVIVVRIPLTVKQIRTRDRIEAQQNLIKLKQEARAIKYSASSGAPYARNAADLLNQNLSEQERINCMISQATSDYDPSNYVKVRGPQFGVVPKHYVCHLCNKSGHWKKDCPTIPARERVEIKKATGIPRSFMVPVGGPQVHGALLTPEGQFVVPLVDHKAYLTMKKSSDPNVAGVDMVEPQIPQDLLCNLCEDLMMDAVMTPCCGISFCDECIRNLLLESEEHECPDCKEKDVSPDTLIPNRFLRNKVNDFKKEKGYERHRPKPEPAAAPAPVAVQEEPAPVVATPAPTTPSQYSPRPSEQQDRGGEHQHHRRREHSSPSHQDNASNGREVLIIGGVEGENGGGGGQRPTQHSHPRQRSPPHHHHQPQQQQQQTVSISTQHLTAQPGSHLSHQPAQIMLVQYPAPGQLQMYQHSS